MRNELTEKDIKKIEEEIEYRKLVVRKEAIEAVKEARAQGDLSENFEYYAAKRDKNKNEWCKKNNIRLIRIPYTDYDNLTIDYLYSYFPELSLIQTEM